jgi:anti-sigma factor RsiW
MTSDVDCVELVELVTDYLEGALDDDRRRAIEAHLSTCDGCQAYLEQMRHTTQHLGHLPLQEAQDLPDGARRDLLAAFRAEYPH